MTHIKAVNPPSLPDPSGRYSHAIETPAGRTLHISGQIALSPNGEVVGRGDIEAQTRAAFDNVRTVLEAAGGAMADVAKMTIFLTRRDDFPTVSRIRSEYFTDPFPACSTVIVQGLVLPDLLIEVEATALLPT